LKCMPTNTLDESSPLLITFEGLSIHWRFRVSFFSYTLLVM